MAVGVALVTVVGLVLTILAIWFPSVLNDDNPPLELGDTGKVGPYSVTLSNVKCNQGLKDVTPRLRKLLEKEIAETGAKIPKGQFCIVRVYLRNDGNSSLFDTPNARIDVRINYYPASGGDTGTVQKPFFPDERIQATYYFDIPKDVSPTALRFAWPKRNGFDALVFKL